MIYDSEEEKMKDDIGLTVDYTIMHGMHDKYGIVCSISYIETCDMHDACTFYVCPCDAIG